jgi:hypothetical protein
VPSSHRNRAAGAWSADALRQIVMAVRTDRAAALIRLKALARRVLLES